MRPRLAARRRRLGLAAPRRLRARHAARPRPRPGARRPRASRCSTPWPAAGRTSSAPCPTQVGSTDDTAPRDHAVGPRLVGAGHRRHLRARCAPCCPAGAPRTGARPSGPRRTRYAGRRGPLGGLGAAPARAHAPGAHRPTRRSPAAGRCCRRSTSTPRCAPTPPPSCCSTGTASSPAARPRPRTCPAASPRSTGCSAAPRRPAGCAAATSSRGSAPSQFGTTGAVDRLRSGAGVGSAGATTGPRPRPTGRRARRQRPGQPLRRAPCRGPTARSTRRPTARRRRARRLAADKRRRHQPGRKAGALVVLVDGDLVLYVERGGKTLLTYTDDPDLLRAAAAALADAVRARQPGPHHRREGRRRPGARLGPPGGRGPRGGRLPPHPARAADAEVSARCPRVTPCTAPPTGSTPPCATPWSSGPSCAGPSVPDVDLSGSRTLEVVARGKHLLHRFDTGATLHTHLRMEGQWRVEHPGARTERVLRRHDLRAAVLTAPWSAFGLRLGMLDLVPTARECDLVGHLGPDVLGPDWDAAVAAARVTASAAVRRRHPARPAGAGRGRAPSGPARSSSSSGCCPGPRRPTSTPSGSPPCSSGCTG